MVADPPTEPTEERLRQWHRLFGIALMEVFEGAPWRVELEQELALRSQLLDVAIIEATGDDIARRCPRAFPRLTPRRTPEPPALDLPDGLENLRPHNLLTYKSRHEALNAWTLDELTGHYVNYRKLRLEPHGPAPSARRLRPLRRGHPFSARPGAHAPAATHRLGRCL